MTGKKDDYDPLAYGQIRLGRGAGPGKGRPEDILFEDAGAGPGPVGHGFGPVSESQQLGGMDQGESVDFARDILNESGFSSQSPLLSTPMSAPPSSGGGAGQRPQPPQRPRPGPDRAPAPGAAHSLREQSMTGPRPGREVLLAPSRSLGPRPRSGVSGLLVSTLVLAAGAIVAAGLYLLGQGVVLASVVGALGLVGAAFTWILLRG